MLKAIQILTERPADAVVADRLTLPFELRQKSRLVAKLDSGQPIALALPRGHILRHGALLGTDGGALIQVCSAPEELSVVTSRDATELARAAYHLGNRHVPLQILPGALSYQHDHVLDDMLRGLGLEPSFAEQPFEPEAGAYGRGGHHHHDHGHDEHDHQH
ncbi:MAG TPA: urease accessory protein UreE [Polyangiaceae bacterium]|nr:urease accessory protein UreE [Polyangiaceae bacterium]